MITKLKNWVITIILGIPLIVSPSLMFAQDNQNGFGGMIGVDGILVPGTDQKQDDSLIHTIQVAINWVLGMLSFVALVLCLYAGFKMLTSGGDSKKYDSGLTILKNAAIGLAIIALSWLIVSLIFWIINGSIGGAVDGSGNNGLIDNTLS